MDMSRSYQEYIAPPVSKVTKKEEIVVEEDADFFKKYINISSNTSSVQTTTNSVPKVGD